MAETTSRALALLSLLQTHRQWSGADLAERLGVTERTLRRDIERLRELGYRVEATRGIAGGYRLEAGGNLPPLLITLDEAVTIAIGLRAAATQGLIDGQTTTVSALAKFEQVLPPPVRQRVNALASAVHPQSPQGAPVSSELLGELALACRDHERIRFHYIAAGGAASDRVVEPHSLVAAERNWFLVCWDIQRADWRTFRVDRMSRFFGTRVHFPPRELPSSDAAEFVAAASASLRRNVVLSVVMAMPFDEMLAHFGPWSRGAEPHDEFSTRWPISGGSIQEVAAALLWIPEGVHYEVEGDPELRAFLQEACRRMAAASAVDPEATASAETASLGMNDPRVA